MIGKQQKCKFFFPFMGKNHDEDYCTFEREDKEIHEDWVTTEEQCEKCQNFKSKYIEYPIKVDKITQKSVNRKPIGHETGTFVAVRPCKKEYKDQTYLGILIGDMPISTTVSYDERNKELIVGTINNPCIFVPALKTLVYGIESFWREIKDPEDFKAITNQDIDNVWYMRLLRDIAEEKEK